MKYLLKIPGTFMLLLLMALTLSCAKDSYFDIDSSGKEASPYTPGEKGRISPVVNRNVMIMISGGRNSLSGYLATDLEELENSIIPGSKYAMEDVLVIISRNGNNNAVSTPASMYRVYRGRNGEVVRDTLSKWGGFTPLFGENTLEDALSTIVDEFPQSHYGIVLSSHATGYLPDGYYKDPAAYEDAHKVKAPKSSAFKGRRSIQSEFFPPIPDYPAVKSIGQDDDISNPVEMELRTFHDIIPCHMDYILFDACLMGGVEVAYELRDKADIIGFSPTEILADGFDYKLLTSRLLKDDPDPVQVCKDYFYQYKKPDGTTTSSSAYATISVIDTEHMDGLAAVCRTLFEKYRSGMNSINAGSVQRYYRMERHFFYDLRDILAKSGASAEDLSALDNALEKVVVYKDHTDYFFGIQIRDDTYSGLSMYLPAQGSDVLDKFYRENIDWNRATQLVK